MRTANSVLCARCWYDHNNQLKTSLCVSPSPSFCVVCSRECVPVWWRPHLLSLPQKPSKPSSFTTKTALRPNTGRWLCRSRALSHLFLWADFVLQRVCARHWCDAARGRRGERKACAAFIRVWCPLFCVRAQTVRCASPCTMRSNNCCCHANPKAQRFALPLSFFRAYKNK